MKKQLSTLRKQMTQKEATIKYEAELKPHIEVFGSRGKSTVVQINKKQPRRMMVKSNSVEKLLSEHEESKPSPIAADSVEGNMLK